METEKTEITNVGPTLYIPCIKKTVGFLGVEKGSPISIDYAELNGERSLIVKRVVPNVVRKNRKTV